MNEAMKVPTERLGHCPRCGAEIDVLLAPAVAVLEGRVVGFCSEECRRAHLREESAARQAPAGRSRRGLLSRLLGSRNLLWVAATVFASGALGFLGYGLSLPVESGRGRGVSVARAREPARSEPEVRQEPSERSQARRSPWSRARAEALAQLSSPVFRDRMLVAEALVGCCRDERALAVLRAGTKDAFWSHRRLAAEALGRLGDRTGFRVLEAELESRRRQVRLAAALTLARLGRRTGLKVLRPYLSSRRYRVTCAAALLATGYGQAEAVLRKVVATEKTDRWDRIRALAALASRGDQEAVARLRERVAAGESYWPVVVALARRGVPEAMRRVERALAYPALRVEAARILGARGVRPDMGPLERDLEADEPGIRATAAAAILWLGGRAP